MSNRIEEIIEKAMGEKQKYDEPPRETEGFESMITEEEFEAIVKVKEAMENYIEVHNKNVVGNIDTLIGSCDYAHIQLMLLGDAVDEAMKAVGLMYSVHNCNKELIDDLAEINGFTVKGLRGNLEKRKFEEALEHIFG